MTEGAGARTAKGVPSIADYKRRLRGSMRSVSARTRDAVAREITAGIEAQLKEAGGQFSRIAPALDDPRWVGRQMVRVYGVAPWVKAAAVAACALLALFSVPGVATQPPDSAGAVVLALVAFGALVAALFWAASRLSATFSLLCGGAAAALRFLGFVLPQGEFSPAQTASSGEIMLFVLATALLLVVATLPALIVRARGERE